MKYILLLFCLSFSTVSLSQNETTNNMEAYLEANGTTSYYASVVDRMFDFLKKEYESQNVPDEVWNELEAVKTGAIKDITEMIGQVYEGHFSSAEINALMAFYNTETGKKITSKTELTSEDIQRRDIFYTSGLGQKISESTASLNNVLQKMTQSWSADLFKLVAHKLEEKGFVKN